ncbi:MAG: hypothetical protein RR622_07820 [Hydrogenoanaerobacterium sp.]
MMKKSTLISIIIALIAIAGALLGLVAYMRSRRCLGCNDVEEDFIPQTDDDYDGDDYYEEDRPSTKTDATGQDYVSSDFNVEADEPEDDKYTENQADETAE